MAWKTASRWASVAGLVLAGAAAGDPPAAPPDPVSPYAGLPTPGVLAPFVPQRPPGALVPFVPQGPPAADVSTNGTKLLDRPLQTPPSPESDFVPVPEGFRYPTWPPLGFTGHTSVLPSVTQDGSDFVPVEDRWRLGMPAWDRYGQGHPPVVDYPYQLGNICDPYNQNVLKGDYPIIGQHTFLNITAIDLQFTSGQQTPLPAHGFESTSRPFEMDFFGSPNQLSYQHYLSVRLDLFHGDAGFKQPDWQVVVTPVFNVNTLNVDELGIVNPDVRKGTQRDRTYFALEEYFVESKLADTSPYFDFVSVRAGSQFFNNDFRGFLFADTDKAVRVFGTNFAQRDQFNVAIFRKSEKDSNSQLNTFNDRGQDVVIANYYRQDFIFPGYTVQASVAYDHDEPTFKFNANDQLVRPDPVGNFKTHTVDAIYLGLASDGHVDRFNVTTQFYWVFGSDTNNELATQAQLINAYMAAAEISYDRDWARFRVSGFFSSGDRNTNNAEATGFDTIQDLPNFAGGQFSFWVHNAIKLFGVNLKQEDSLVPDLRSSKVQGQANFVNPGLILVNVGVDFDLTPKLKMVNNCNFLWFDTTEPIKTLLFDGAINSSIGTDLSMGFEYRPLLSNNVIMLVGVSSLIPGGGFRSIYDFHDSAVSPLVAAFAQLTLTY